MTRRIYIPLVLTLVFLALVAIVLVVAGRQVSRTIEEAFSGASDVRTARFLVARTISRQLDEETGVRGYAVVRQRTLLQPYYVARAELPRTFARLRRMLTDLKMPTTRAVLDDAAQTNRRWVAQVAYPIITFKRVPAKVQLHGKRLVDRFRSDLEVVENSLAARANQAQRRAQQAIYGVTLFAIGAVAAVIVAATLFTVQQYRLAARLERTRARAEEERRRAAESRSAYEAEKRIADTLQGAFTQNLLPQMAKVLFSATYLPAAEEARVGGDWYDVLELTEHRVLLTIGDVTGHGIDAAVAMNRARHLLVSCALVDPNPGAILERANSDLFSRASPLITAVAGIVDSRNCEFVYATAGHPPPVLLEPGCKPRMLDFGSLPLGVMGDANYRSHRIVSVPGAMLVLYTDGAIEHSHNVVEGEALLLQAVEAAAAWPAHNAAAMISASIFSNRRIVDDVAILTIRFGEDSGSSVGRVA
ncbi:MAG TPA: SpoIIE family protein phosphatase [Candidatus Cybelea sp.]|jgi:serine phosphatase RsbU (regulator of sigma subunit)